MHGVNLNKIEHKTKFGKILISTDIQNELFYIKAIGGITPYLLKKDYEELLTFAENVDSFDYVVDISKLLWAHPINLKYLFKIKNHPKKRAHYVISSFWLQRSLAHMFRWVLTIEKTFESFQKYQEYKSNQ